LDCLSAVNILAEKDALQWYPALRLLDLVQALRDDGAVACEFSNSRALERSPAMSLVLESGDDSLMPEAISD
jgi:hypothetical protein